MQEYMDMNIAPLPLPFFHTKHLFKARPLLPPSLGKNLKNSSRNKKPAEYIPVQFGTSRMA